MQEKTVLKDQHPADLWVHSESLLHVPRMKFCGPALQPPVGTLGVRFIEIQMKGKVGPLSLVWSLIAAIAVRYITSSVNGQNVICSVLASKVLLRTILEKSHPLV